MSGAGFILAINVFVAGLFAAAFFMVGATNRSAKAAPWLGLAYLCGVGYFVFEFLLPLQADAKFGGFLAFASFLAALGFAAVGIALRYGVAVPWTLLGAVAAVSMAGNWFAFELPRESFVRMMIYQLPYAAMQGICAALILSARRGQPLDVTLFVVFALSAVQFLSKPLVSQLTGGPGNSPQEYIGTNYALYSQSLGTILSVAAGLLMLTVLVRDMLTDVTARSETDPLSGLFNRRGFDDRVEPGLVAASRGGVPAALVVVDLDHFKAVNDTFGHEAGDRVIRGFAQLLRSVSPQRAITARMGGEEFAVFLPGTNLAAARLFAEGVRAAFANRGFDGIPADMRVSASFGVAECRNGESLSDLRHRADQALYAAKRKGRDSVAVAADPAIREVAKKPARLR